MKPHRRAIPFVALVCSLALALGAGRAQGMREIRGGWIICTRDLQLREALIERADERALTLLNAYGIRSVVGMERVLFMVRSDDAAPSGSVQSEVTPQADPGPVRRVTLTDGQVVRGIVLDPEHPDELALRLIAGRSVHGEAHIPLDRVLRIEDQDAPSVRQGAGELRDDLVVARNGDRFTGFVERVGTSVGIELEGGGVLELPADRVEQIAIANDAEPVEGVYLRFDGHERLRVHDFLWVPGQPIRVRVDTDALGLEDTGSNAWRFDAGTLAALRVVDADALVLALSTLEPVRVEPTGDRDWAPSPTLIDEEAAHPALNGLDLHSPVRLVYELPEGATRFACVFEASVERWTDCVARVRVTAGGRERTLSETRLNHERAEAAVNLSLPPGTRELVIEIDPGEHGPIQDRVLLRGPRVLIEG